MKKQRRSKKKSEAAQLRNVLRDVEYIVLGSVPYFGGK